ncbi:uncharacterized protein LOC112571306 isoform X2 [Pomacea canaliculata]|uniref:uncharacterized protein LOC112571306 isoform X2 n=1 Tax=Pomacea canaliculata TaxID=400727 RepID=UPI000D72CD61|nr:uncharacterized protein LOC112571306 isoform X2 [Pomacea canaliculata]
MATNDKLEYLNLSQDEIKRLEEALKKEEFRKLLVEYAEEISNPENKRRYEEEIAQLERERGMDVTFVTPEPGYVLKTSVNGTTKAFINISKSDKLDKPNSTRQQGPDGKNGLLWQIPHSFAPPREDRDKSKRICQFAEGCDVATSDCSVDVHQDNVTILLLKDRSARSLWQQFWAGIDSTTLKEHQFQTCTVLEQQLDQLDAAAAEQEESRRTSCEQLANLQVLTMDEKKLTVKVCPAAANKKQAHRYTSDEDEEYDPPSSAEIQVVHSRPPPLLHGILKQHTVSESSEDQNGDQESPRSPGEEEEELSSSLGKRRSVSFSEHIDQATFKTSSAVSSMTMALKSKRRRQRKREERGSRRRHNSGGSEGSGDDQTHSLSDSHSLSEEESGHDRTLKLTQNKKWRTASSPSVADCTPKIEEVKLQNTSLPKCEIDQEGKGEIEITQPRYEADSGKHCMLKHISDSSASAQAAGEEAREKKVHPAANDSSGNRCIVECANDDIPLVTADESIQKSLPITASENGQKCLLVKDDKANNTIFGTVDGKALRTQPVLVTDGVTKPCGTLAERTKHVQSACGDNTLAVSSEHVNSTSYHDVFESKHSLEGKISLASKLASGNGDDNLEDMRMQEQLTITREAEKLQNKEGPHPWVNGTADKTDKYKIEESEKSLNPTGFEENQHRTQCAFKFSNTVIFDLDCE